MLENIFLEIVLVVISMDLGTFAHNLHGFVWDFRSVNVRCDAGIVLYSSRLSCLVILVLVGECECQRSGAWKFKSCETLQALNEANIYYQARDGQV